MNKLKILGGEKKLEAKDISEFEKKFNISLPDNYKKFILKHNGGYIDEYHDTLASFMPIKYGVGLVEHAIKVFSNDESILDKDFIPIANQHSGNPITLCLKEGENYGKIILFYFDRVEEPELVANSLEELLGVKNIDEF